MSSTMVMTMSTSPVPILRTDPSTSSYCCVSCGSTALSPDLLHAQTRIADLEDQVRLLQQKASAAVDRWADYEDELSRLRGENQQPPPPPPKTPDQQVSPRGGFLSGGANRLSALLSPRKSLSNLTPAPAAPKRTQTSPGPTTTEDLIEALTREQGLRKEAEGKLDATSQEVEELSVTLFEQANQMVADERRARAKLEERVDELERRDAEKRGRLEKLESAMSRIERVRNLLEEEVERD